LTELEEELWRKVEEMYERETSFYVKYIKRLFDLAGSFIGLIILSPVLLIVAVLVHIKLGSPVIFRQERAGQNGVPFYLCKFRSMTEEKDEKGKYLPDEARLKKFGKILRSTSLDELPGLINVIKGEMSVIGPRPLPTRYLNYYTEKESHRHDVRPGITGLAQINGRNYVTWEDKFAMDLEYVNKVSFMFDLKILLKTITVVFRHENIETGSKIEHDGIVYQPLDIERR